MALPLTSTRLSACLSIVAVHQAGDSALPFNLGSVGQLSGMFANANSAVSSPTLNAAKDLALNAAEYASSWTTLGATMGMKVGQTSTPIGRGGINSSIEKFGMLPGKIETTLTIDKTLLHYEDAMSAFKFMPGNIALQTTPLIIIENLSVPDSPEIEKRFGSFERKMGTANAAGISNFGLLQPNIYVGCRITNSEVTYDINSADQMVIQNITMSVARIINPLAETTSQVAGLLGGLGLDSAASAVTTASTVLASNVSIINKIAR